jgi:Type II secretion system (T2SS), protein E, N-terminal domain
MSMTSRLSSLLVRDGVVEVKRMQKAIQRQVLFEGALDTVLLEMNEVPEQRLLQYLSLATGLPPATARELEGLEPRAAQRCPRELAERFGVVPLSFDGDALRVLARDPVDLGALEDLASELGTPVQPFVAPEFRFELAFDRVFGRPSEERYSRLAEASRLSVIPPVGGAPSVVVGTLAQPAAPAEPVGASGSAPVVAGEVTVQAQVSGAQGAVAPAVDAEPSTVVADSAAELQSDRPSMRQTQELTAEALRRRRRETDRQAAMAYERHGDGQAAELPAAEDTTPDAHLPDPSLAPAGEPLSDAPTVVGGGRGVRAATDAIDAAVREGEADFVAELAAQKRAVAREGVHARDAEAPAADAVQAAPEVLSASASEVVIEYDAPDSGALAVTAPLPRPSEDAQRGVVAGAIGPDESSESMIRAHAAPAAPMAGTDSGASTQTFRRIGGFDPSPLTVAAARALLAEADHRDTIFQILLRAIRARAWYVGLLTVQGGAAIGRVAIAGDAVDQIDIGQTLIPLDTQSAFRQAVASASPYIGPVATGDRDIDGMIRRLGGVIPPSALLLPVVLRNRVVALVIGHRGADMLQVTEVSEVLPLAAAASEALGRVIMRGKAQSKQMPAAAPPAPEAHMPAAGQPAPEAPTEPVMGAATIRMPAVSPEALTSLGEGLLTDPGEARTTKRVATGTGESAAAVEPIAPDVDALMVALQSRNEDAASGAMEEALGRPADIVPWLRRHFPGKLVVDRDAMGGSHMRAAQHGRLLELVVSMGDASAELLAEKLADDSAEVRYYAALCAAEVRALSLLAPLVDRVFDPDLGTRALAIEALSRFPAAALEEALEPARRALHGDDIPRVESAAAALSELADVHAIPELLELHTRGGEATAIASRALVRLTTQDFGDSSRKWRHWWDKNRRRNRIEWLLEGLAHKDPELRRSAAEDLRKATGEYFGYHHDLPRREREQARQRWLDWWNQTGRTRFPPRDETRP